MGMLSRFRDIMASNINALMDKANDPEKMMDAYMRDLNRDVGQVRAETASVLAEERRAKRAWEEGKAEVAKLQRYADKATEAGNGTEAAKFLDRKATQEEKEAQLRASSDLAASNAANMKQMEEKLVADLSQLEARRTGLKGKMAATQAQISQNAMSSPLGGAQSSVFDAVEDKVNAAYEEAKAVAELRAGTKGNLDEEFELWEKQANEKKRKEQE